MRISFFMLLALSIASPLALAHDGKGKCTCTKTCMKQCKEGHGEKCKCKTCGCAKGKTCAKCHHGDEKAPIAPDADKK